MSNTSSLSLPLDKLYQLCLTGGYGLISAYELANQHKIRYPFHSDSLDKLIKQEANKVATLEFLTAFSGFITLSIILPASAISILFIQMRLVVTIAILQGHDINDKRIQLLMYFSLCMISGKSELQQFCLKTLMKQPNKIIVQMSQQIIQQLIASLSAKHSVKFIKVLPLLGGVTGAVIDRMITYRIGQFAKRQFNCC